ncbi:LCP family glycopolymer transferase [Agilicoccus flavus]|uniref:LCP family glycopolymer transferase n=1 Tax=Agilicoccus flavus TaxID=2775968 RepID=UPI001CF67A86|nr:LCP family protein [Agilicoccus flavus]
MSYLPDERYAASSRGDTGGAQADDSHRHSLRSFLGHTLLGTVLPGSGLLLLGRRWAGGIVLGGFVALVVGLTTYFAWHGTLDAAMVRALSAASDPTVLLVGCIVGVSLGLVWLWSVLWTARLTWPSRPQTGRRVAAAVVAAALTALLVAPSALAARYALIQRETIAKVFVNDKSPTGMDPGSGGEDAWALYPRVNILLVGADSEADREGVRTDSMMLASIDTQTGDTVLFGLPRNLENVPFPSTSPLAKIWPEGFRCQRDCLLNDVWQQGVTHAALYPGDPQPGLTALSEAITEVTGLAPDYAAVVNMQSFSALVNAMGGVEIDVKARVPIGGKLDANRRIVPGSIKGWIEPGRQRLDGYHAMWYARGRVTTDDFDRMRRQRCMVGALVKQVNPTTMIQRYPALAAVAQDNLYTNIPQKDLGAFAQLVTRMKSGTIRSLPFSNKNVHVGNPDFDKIRAMVQEALTPAPAGAATPSSGSTPSEPTSTPSRTGSGDDETGSGDKTTAPSEPSGSGTPSSAPTEGAVKVSEAC